MYKACQMVCVGWRTVGASVLAAGMALSSPACADILGLYEGEYEYNSADSGSFPFIGSDFIQLTTGPNQRRSIFFYEPQPVSGFTATFTYRCNNSTGCSSGLCFVLQNNPAGVDALGSDYGYRGMTQSIALTLEVPTSTSGVYTNGNLGGGSGSTSPVDLDSGHDIDITIDYDGSKLFVEMMDTVTGQVYAPPGRLVGDIRDFTESETAYIGFTATSANCSNGANHTLSNFRYFIDGCPADFNDDGGADTRDVIAFLNAWNAGDDDADFNSDGTIDTRDVTSFLNAWVTGC